MIWVELCCGSAAVTLRLLGGEHAKPLVPYQGGKRKYAAAILGALGLRAGQSASQIVLCDAGPWGLVWQQLASGVDLRPHVDKWNHSTDVLQEQQFATLRDAWREIADPAERAGAWLWLLQRSYGGKGPKAGMTSRHITNGPKSHQGEWRHTLDAPVPALGRLQAMPWPTTTVHHHDVREVEPIPGAVVYLDPDYDGTTGFEHSLPRAEVLALAWRWHRAGAVVVVSEAGPLPMEGWYHLEITSARTSTPRNWSRQHREWLTMNREPVSVPATQLGMFEVAP